MKSSATFIDYHVTPVNYGKFKIYAGHIYYDLLPLFPTESSFITILRNPGARLLSLFHYFRSLDSGADCFEEVVLAKKLDFHDWLECGESSVINNTSNAIIRHFVPMSYFHSSHPACRQNILTVAQNFVGGFSVVGFSEYISVTAEILRQTFNFSFQRDAVPCLNKNAYGKVVYSKSRLRDFVQRECSLDLEFLAYCVSIFKRQCTDDLVKEVGGIEKKIYLEYLE